MKPIQYIFALLLGCLAAFLIGSLMSLTSASTTIDAWMLSFTISGHDVGDRMTMFVRTFLENSNISGITGFSYLIGHSISEEIVKFLMFLIAFKVSKPSSIREIILTGMSVGIGFALCETVAYYDMTPFFQLQSIFLRSVGHGLFTGLIAMLFWFGYFSQLRWIDAGARKNMTTWIMRYAELLVLIFWTVFGLLVAACLHSMMNIMTAIGAQMLAIISLMVCWSLFITVLVRPESRRPYGNILREMVLLQTITDARENLADIEKITHISIAEKLKKPQFTRKQFAKR